MMTLRFLIFILSLVVSHLCFAPSISWGAIHPALSLAAGGPVLVVHDGTARIEADVVRNLSRKLAAAGYTVCKNVGVPRAGLAVNKQIWDVRFNNSTPLSPGDINAYLAYLASGGSLFVMGENLGFLIRDNSIVSLIQAAGGGAITMTTPDNVQTVQSSFTGPSAVAGVAYLAAAGTTAAGSLSFITRDAGNVGSAILYGPGALINAPAGSLLIVFDVNFLQAGASPGLQNLSDNIIAYMGAPVMVPPALPPAVSAYTPSEWAMILLAGGLMLGASRGFLLKERRAHAQVAVTHIASDNGYYVNFFATAKKRGPHQPG